MKSTEHHCDIFIYPYKDRSYPPLSILALPSSCLSPTFMPFIKNPGSTREKCGIFPLNLTSYMYHDDLQFHLFPCK